MTALVTGSANEPLARAIAAHLGVDVTPAERLRFPDGEAGVTVGPAVRAEDVFVVQSLTPAVDPSLVVVTDTLTRGGDAPSRCACAASRPCSPPPSRDSPPTDPGRPRRPRVTSGRESPAQRTVKSQL